MSGQLIAVAAALPNLHGKALATIAGRSPCPVATYRSIATGVASLDLRHEEAEPLRRRFNAYYGVRRNVAWRASFYERFEAAKNGPAGSIDLFADIVRSLSAETGRVEASFVSKLVATIDPEYPIIDSVVRKWLGSLTETPPFKGGVDVVTAYYVWLTKFMREIVRTPEAQAWSKAFEATFPLLPGEQPISQMKQIDFLIWAGADR
ncbi:hypothetical protein [Phenylobacterium koreense]|uniref:Globin n=1 Tax=Phenylobacterium koreense TaxID=266125 RepID=A0ABV2EJF9_9CAUL